MGVNLDKWIEKVRRCEYLAEDELKALCEYVRTFLRACLKLSSPDNILSPPPRAFAFNAFPTRVQVKEILVEESNVQPVNSPVTVSHISYSSAYTW